MLYPNVTFNVNVWIRWYVLNRRTGLLVSKEEQFSELIPTVVDPQNDVFSAHSSDENLLFISQQDEVVGQ
jgi:hypothetical protein